MLNEKFATPQAVTRACLTCHADAVKVMKTSHWLWLGDAVQIPGRAGTTRIGKKNLIDNFCISTKGNEKSCMKCHIGFGWADDTFDFNKADNVDCLVCLQPGQYTRLLEQPPGAVTFLVANTEGPALAAWKGLTALGVSNLYLVEGGINRWLALYAVPACVATPGLAVPGGAAADASEFRFNYATGDSLPAAWPELPESRGFRTPCDVIGARSSGHGLPGIEWPKYDFTKRVKLQNKAAVKGGCG